MRLLRDHRLRIRSARVRCGAKPQAAIPIGLLGTRRLFRIFPQQLSGSFHDLRMIRFPDVGQKWKQRTRLRDARKAHRLMQHANRIDCVPQVFQWPEDLPNLLGTIPIRCTNRDQHLCRQARRDADATGGEACESEVSEMNDRRLLADAADDELGIDQSDKLLQVVVLRGIRSDDRVFDSRDQLLIGQPFDVLRLHVPFVFHVKQGGTPAAWTNRRMPSSTPSDVVIPAAATPSLFRIGAGG